MMLVCILSKQAQIPRVYKENISIGLCELINYFRVKYCIEIKLWYWAGLSKVVLLGIPSN